MKKTTKTLLSLLLVLVMALQFGAVAPAARAEGELPGSAAVSLYVLAPVDEDGNLSSSAQTNGQLKDSSILSSLATLSDVAALQANGLVLTPPEGYAVASLYIAAAVNDDLLEAVSEDFASLTGNGAEIEIDPDFFSAGKFNATSTAYTLGLVLARVTAVEAKAATCTEAGNDAYYTIAGELYLLDEIPVIAAPGTHSDPLTHHEAVAATAEADGNIEYWECSVCGKYFSDANGENEITDKTSVVTHYEAPADRNTAHEHTLQEVPAVEATATADGNIQYWKCTDPDCDKFFSDANGENEITDKTSVVTHYQAPAATTCRLSFDAHGGTGNMDPMDVTVGEAYTVPACGFTAPENKEFSHWLRGDEVLHPDDPDTISGDNTLVAIWKDAAAPAHTHSLTLVPAKNATATADGNRAYYTCSGCTDIFLDAEGQQPTTLEAVKIDKAGTPAILSDTETEWKADDQDGLSLHFDADFATNSAGIAVDVDGTAITAFSVREGSVIVLIEPSYMATLTPGTHTIVVHFPSGHDVTVEVTVPTPAPGTTALAFAFDVTGFTKVYDGNAFDLNSLKNYISLTSLPAGHKADVEITYEGGVTELYNVGTAVVKLHLKSVKDASDTDVTSSFTCADANAVVTITKRKITVETRDDSKVYDGKSWSYTHMKNPQPIMTYTDPKLGEYIHSGNTFVQTISIKYTAAPKNMGTYENSAELIIREKVKGSSGTGVDVTSNYEITYKFGKIKITDSSGKIPAGTTPVTGDANNIWIWVGLMAAAVVIVVVLLVVTRKGRKGDKAPSSGAPE